ncbi:hypothetical protein [Evansella cellulosilytica]|uniref:DUF4129 domain-containing protein n=1 Tax=Evansella cellulosilytica (strain ATCC 21833 / DSM 2522 / FERM P-1141 / JCM 9156 / N-4) TaxID=649639 RepID=E6TZ28_EVAC2|nr:hypothetical protein [Evansella cellulosilytica]ADU32471.1 hypothetical protein Bcell_4244 [Evansella cellulosilytica DSM 2522]
MADHAREQLEKILDTPEYQVYYEDNRGLIERIIDFVLHWIGELLSRLFPNIAIGSGVSGAVFVFIVILGLALLVVIFLLVARTIKRRRTFRDNQPLQAMNEMSWSYEKHLLEAEKHEGKGEYSLATRHMFLGLLLYYHDINWLEAKIWKTNWEYYDELRKVKKSDAELFFKFAILFDEVTYGERLIEKEEYIPFRDEVANILKGKQEDHN